MIHNHDSNRKDESKKMVEVYKTINTAIMVDGAFYQKRAKVLFGEKTAEERAEELEEYCRMHISARPGRFLYRIFYYDCPPSEAVVYNPITKNSEPLSKTKLYSWEKKFHEELCHKRKIAVRMGELLKTQEGYSLKPEALKALMSGKKTLDSLCSSDLKLEIKQKGVDMKPGIDVATLAYGKFVDQIIMIAGDSDFVPAAKLARRQGIDFILDPMKHRISKSLSEHVDGIQSCYSKMEKRQKNRATKEILNL